jgi:small subunit ribosomal protein S16
MLVFRLFRTGKKDQPSFKIIVTDKRRSSTGGRFIEQVGFLNPISKEKKLNVERIEYWLSKGVQPSSTLYNLFVAEGILEGKKIPVQKKKKEKKEKEEKPKTEQAKPEEKKEEAPKQEETKPKEKKEESAPAPVEEKKEEPAGEEKKEQG